MVIKINTLLISDWLEYSVASAQRERERETERERERKRERERQRERESFIQVLAEGFSTSYCIRVPSVFFVF